MRFWVAGACAIALAAAPSLAQDHGRDHGRANGHESSHPRAVAAIGNGKDRGRANAGKQGRRNDPVSLAASTLAGGKGSAVRMRLDANGVADGCPPGLARKYADCRAPRSAAQTSGNSYRRYAPEWWGLGSLLREVDGSFLYDDGYLLQLGQDNRIAGYIPLLGGALSIGNSWPVDYRYASLPPYYESYYGLGQSDYYRYADNIVYRLDPDTTAITSIAAMLTGDDFVVGQRMPDGYDVYNVPYSYRDRYPDGPDMLHRYNNGHVYRIDPQTRVVASAIELLI